MSSSAEAPAAVGFAFLDARVRAAVERAAAGDPNPGDPLRGLYISDDQALSLAADLEADDADARLADAAARLGLDALDTAVLGLCAAPELHPRYGRLFAYLHDDVTRRLASPRLVGD
ncbi:MAG: ATP-binding protein, partial [Actinomycetota bacterium]|nr:ATP-binding protein [Actinomycetota bacterium]